MASIVESDDPYNLKNITALENLLDEQTTTPTSYSFPSNKLLLKLYTLTPTPSLPHARIILLLGLSNLPSTDFLAYLHCMSPEVETGVKDIVDCFDAAEKCDFPTFWSLIKSLPEYPSIPSLPNSLRSHILTVLSLSYQSCPVAVYTSNLDVSSPSDFTDDEIVECIKGGGGVEFKKNEYNSPKPKAFGETITVKSLKGVM